jgi:hypothetical protein
MLGVTMNWLTVIAMLALDPYAIYANARAYWLHETYAPRYAYTIAVDVHEGGTQRVERYDADYDAVNGITTVDPMSDYQRDHPTYVSGINVGLPFWHNKPLPPIDFLGVPHLTPTYSFGMAPFVPAPTPTPFDSAALVAQIRNEFHDPNPRARPSPAPSPGGLREIASVIARNHDYTIALLGTETVDGHACYHLTLTPLRDPSRLRIRQAWIDEQTYAPWQLVDASNFTGGPGTAVPWTIRFADVDGAHLIREEDAQQPMPSNGQIFTTAAIRFENVHAVSAPAVHPQLVNTAVNALTEPAWPGGNRQ